MNLQDIADVIKADLETFDPQKQFVLDAEVNGDREAVGPVKDAKLAAEFDTIIAALQQEWFWSEQWPVGVAYEMGLDPDDDEGDPLPTDKETIDFLRKDTNGWYLGVLGEHDGATFSQFYHFNIDKYNSVLIVRRGDEVATRIVERY